MQTEALGVVRNAQASLKAFNADPSSRAGKEFAKEFKTAFGVDPTKNTAALEKYGAALGHLSNFLTDNKNFKFQEGDAGINRMATMRNGQPLLDTQKFYGKGVARSDQVRAMIHEPLHMLGNRGLGGDGSDGTLWGAQWLATQSPRDALNNPDNYARFIMGQFAGR